MEGVTEKGRRRMEETEEKKREEENLGKGKEDGKGWKEIRRKAR